MPLTATLVIIAITCLASFYAFPRPDLKYRWMMNPYSIRHRQEYYRFITSGFIHHDHMHLLMNMLSLYFLGSLVERVFVLVFGSAGIPYYVLLYLLAIVVSDIPTYFKQQNNPSYNSLGASGGVSAVVFAFILFEPMQYICVFFAICMPGFILGTLFVGYSYFQGKRSRDNINHDAHLFGAVVGLVFCVVMYPPVVPEFLRQVSSWFASF